MNSIFIYQNKYFKLVNKLTTLAYPQWTQGTQLSTTGEDRFIQPFSQVIGASPVVRVRVGDVIKSNYSKFNFGFVVLRNALIPSEQDSGVLKHAIPLLFNNSKLFGASGAT